MALLALALTLVDAPGARVHSASAWSAAIAFALLAAWPPTHSLWHLLRQAPSRLAAWLLTREGVIVVSLLLAGAALRSYDLAGYPTGINNDEAEFGLIARQILRGEGPHPFGTAFLGDSALYFYILAFFVAALGDNLVGLRFFGALSGVLTLIVYYAFARRLFPTRIALLALALLAGSAAHVHFSRLALNVPQVTLLETAAFFALWQAQQSSRAGWWFIAGLLGGLAVYFHFGGRLAPVVVGLYCVYLLVTRRQQWRTWLTGSAACLLGGLLVLAPLAAHLWRQPGEFTYHVNARLIFNLWPEVTAAYGTTSLPLILAYQLALNLLGFVAIPDGTNFFYTFTKMPLLVPLLAPFFAVGMGLLLVRAADPRYGLLAIWFATYVAVGVVTNSPPQAHRLVNVLPVAALATALAIDLAVAWARRLAGCRGRALATAALLLPLAAALVDNVNYFGLAASNDPWEETTVHAQYVAAHWPDYYFYTLGPGYFSFDHGTRKYLAPEATGESLKEPPTQLPATLRGERGLAFLVFPAVADQLPRLRALYPEGREEMVTGRNGRVVFTAYLVPRAAD